jgi:methylated-DNA-[protein]-cysteine S-methyltransferase
MTTPTSKPTPKRVARVASPLGALLAVTDAAGALVALDFADCEPRMRRLLRARHGCDALVAAPAPPAVEAALAAYFAGDLGALAALPTRAPGTAFQRRVWRALLDVAPGATESYGALAARIGRPGAARAVGLANGANAMALVVPCHRVIGAGGALTGYAGGVARKRWLLAHERAHAGAAPLRRSA